jgi:hypothetical protein
MLTESWTTIDAARLIVSGVVLSAAFFGLIAVDKIFTRRRRMLERNQFAAIEHGRRTGEGNATGTAKIRLHMPLRIFGIGPLAWRQWQGAKRYRTSLFVAIVVPFLLSCMPAFSGVKGIYLVMNLIGGLAFYSFLLLPTALKFDFRRDVDRLAVLKTLPISPLGVIAGQLATPVLITSIFQAVVLLSSMLVCPFHAGYLFVAAAVLVPFNVFIFGLENLIFIWYPHRMHQEGIQVFLRSILAFTAKSLMFGVTLALTYGWVGASNQIAENMLGDNRAAIGIFSVGMFTALGIITALTVLLLARSFERIDPSRDLSGLD